ncbi:hypothetical protein SISNIDRAFT_541179 [Sistotremastrum niveocremeum HHB9708]|uniref:Uncharacterized protein n=1 Tax=Sistotremastrum niveocremeum HHB9708 TaxID=1314777 RepID=A0A164MLC6_9AGAM|nr:hypothetical protein SISNIDRAFT_541179 [Sistotremastrum niveocremeum HHB9708]
MAPTTSNDEHILEAHNGIPKTPKKNWRQISGGLKKLERSKNGRYVSTKNKQTVAQEDTRIEVSHIIICPVAEGDDSMDPPSLHPAGIEQLVRDGLAVDRDGDGPIYLEKEWTQEQVFSYVLELMAHLRRYAIRVGIETNEMFVGARKTGSHFGILPKNPSFSVARFEFITKGQRFRGARPPLLLARSSAVRQSLSKGRLARWKNGGWKEPVSSKGKGKAGSGGDTSDDLASEEPLSTVLEKRLKRKAQEDESDDDRPLQPHKKKRSRSPTPFPSPAPSPEPEAPPAEPVPVPAPVPAPVVVAAPAPVVVPVPAPIAAAPPPVVNPPAVIVIPDSPPAHRLRRRRVRPVFEQASTSFDPFA